MSTPLSATSAYILDPGSGYALSAMHQRVAEIIRDYEPTLELMWIPPDKRDPLDMDKPFVVVCRPGNVPPYVVMKMEDNQVDESVLAALIIRDNNHTSVLDKLEACEFADQAMRAKEDAERELERRDFVESVIKSPLHSYRHNGRVYQ